MSEQNPLLDKFNEKLNRLSPELRAKIKNTPFEIPPNFEGGPVSESLLRYKLHCNAGKTTAAGLELWKHCNAGGKIFLTMSGAGSSFQQGKLISELIRAGKIAGISVTGANMEESVYRLVADSCYKYIPDYSNLTPGEENELGDTGLRRITDTFLPEEESTRVVLPAILDLWKKADQEGKSYDWHEFFFQLFEEDMIPFDPAADARDCWMYQAWKHKIPVFVPGWEDSTMGNIFTYYTYNRNHPFLSKYKEDPPISMNVVKHAACYMHNLAEWYMDTATVYPHAFLQLGGGIAADFSICVVPHLKKDYMADESLEVQKKEVPTWAAFVEIGSSPMSFGSYSGAAYKEKITWEKLALDAPGFFLHGDYTEHFPDIAAIVLGW